MRDKRPVDELSVEELERILAIKRREERQQRMQRMQRHGRIIETVDAPEEAPVSAPPPLAPLPDHDPVAAALSALTRPVAPAPNPSPTAALEPAAEIAGTPAFEEYAERSAAASRPDPRRRRFLDRVLLLVEISAVVLIGVIALNLVQSIGRLDAETASAQALADEQRRAGIPTLAPTPVIRLAHDVVLPGGHIVTAGGQVQFNYAEVPAHLIPIVQSQWVQPVINRPPPTSETALSLIIPRLNLNSTIVQGWDEEALKQGVGQSLNGVTPGDDYGNLALAAHNDIYGKLFEHLDQLEIGDTFQIQTQTKVYTYSITETRVVEPNEVEVLQPRQGATATLISCYPYQVNDKRIVVFADRIG